jgi:CHAD domain-containing protein
MQAVVTEKWIQGVSPGDHTGDVARHTLQGRLGAVLHYLPLAAEKAEENIEYVHQLRVWTRRAVAALRLYKDWLPRRRLGWIEKQLKRIRRAANDARDCDVLIRRLEKKHPGHGTKRWLETVRAEREEAQKAVVAVHDRLRHGHRFARRVDQLLQRVRRRGRDKARAAPPCFGDWARERLRPVVEQFFAAVPADRADEAALHRFRIRGKELRYAMELLAGAFPEPFRTELYPAVEAVQDRLGEINDLATATARLRQEIEAAGNSPDAASWRRLLPNEQAQLDRARQQFWQWCTAPKLRELRDGFEAMLAGPDRSGSVRDDPPPGAPPGGESPACPSTDTPARSMQAACKWSWTGRRSTCRKSSAGRPGLE